MDTKNLIAQTALRLFIKQGFTDVSVNEIIGEAGVTKGGFYHYYKSKDTLILYVFNTFIAGYFQEIEADLNSGQWTASEKLRRFFDHMVCYDDHLHKHMGGNKVDFRQFYLLMMEGMKKYNYMLSFRIKLQSQMKRLMVEALMENKEKGHIPPDSDCEAMAMKTLALQEGAVMLKVLDANIELKAVVKNSVKDFYRQAANLQFLRGLET